MTRDELNEHKAKEMEHRTQAQINLNQEMEMRRAATALDQKASQKLRMGLSNENRLEGLQLLREATTLRLLAEGHRRLASEHGKAALYHSIKV